MQISKILGWGTQVSDFKVLTFYGFMHRKRSFWHLALPKRGFGDKHRFFFLKRPQKRILQSCFGPYLAFGAQMECKIGFCIEFRVGIIDFD